MDRLLKKVKDIYSEGCVSIIMNTKRSRLENQKAPILLKNLIKDAEERLREDYSPELVNTLISKLKSIADEINHSEDLESLILFVNKDIAEYTRLPIEVENRVIIGNSFATRDIVRALHRETDYYILVLSRHQARLIEAFNEKFIKEFQDEFPMLNELYTLERDKAKMPKNQDLLTKEFFNRVDKMVIEKTKDNPLPIMIVTDSRNYDFYMEIADNKKMIMGHIVGNRDKDRAHHIIEDTWKEVLTILQKRQTSKLSELKRALSSGKILSDFTDIWKALKQGKGNTLFVKKRFFQPAIVENDIVKPVKEIQSNRKGNIDDIVDEMIEINLAHGGNTVFVEGNALEKFNNLALTTRY